MSKSNSPGLLARLFRRGMRGRGGFVAEVHARAIGRPLMVEPARGEALLRGWLYADAEMPPEPAEHDSYRSAGAVAIIDVSGPLVSRPMGMCSPLSYEEIGAAFGDALADGNVSAIVLRLDSLGGEAAGCFDLADRIFAERGQGKRIVALIDDMACSAAYALASACDEVWISRTGAAGSVGIVAYHVDQSGADQQIGVKVEYVYAGAHKIDGNPHEPLSGQARSAWQAEVDRLYGLFVATTARNRGMGEQAVRDTEAAVYFGENAVSAGLADRIGTLPDLLAELSGMADATLPEPEPEPTKEDDATAPPTAAPQQSIAAATALDAEAAAEIVRLCVEAGVPAIAAEHIRAGRLLADVRMLLADAPEIRVACSAAGMPDLAADYIRRGTPLVMVRQQLLDARAEEGPTHISSHVLPTASPAGLLTLRSAADIYAARRAATAKR